MTWHISALYIYPVKSLGGNPVQSLQLDAFGPQFDRRFMLVSPDGEFITQRQVPVMSQISAHFDGITLTLKWGGDNVLLLPLDGFVDPLDVQVWDDEVRGLATIMSLHTLEAYLNMPLRLVYMPEQCFRQVDRDFFDQDQRVSFADGFPVLLTNTASLDDLNRRLPAPIDMDRFRPNIVVTGPDSYGEDAWKKVQLGSTLFEVVKPCSRCAITTIDAEGKPGKEPLATLARYRRNEYGVCFGQNAVHLGPGTLHVGDAVKILK